MVSNFLSDPIMSQFLSIMLRGVPDPDIKSTYLANVLKFKIFTSQCNSDELLRTHCRIMVQP